MNNPFDRQEQAGSPRAKIIATIERLSTLFRASLQEQSKQLGLSPLQIQIILFIAYHSKSSCNTSSIAEEFAVTKPTVSDAVRVLVEKKLLLKKTNAKDARASILQLSVKGNKLLDVLSGLTEDSSHFMKAVEDSEIESVWNGMLILMQQLQSSKIIPMRMCFNCDHFGKDHVEGAPHYCHLMEQPLTITDLRIDCPEHKLLISES
jgi:DNA-binding MarR family transcriptional regulator